MAALAPLLKSLKSPSSATLYQSRAMQRLRNKVCLITGAAQGIGLATALKFARGGAVAAVCDIVQAAVDDAVLQCRALGARGGRPCDGRDALVNNDQRRGDRGLVRHDGPRRARRVDRSARCRSCFSAPSLAALA